MHQKIQELSWEPAYHTPVSHYGTDYTFRKAKKKDPLAQRLPRPLPFDSSMQKKPLWFAMARAFADEGAAVVIADVQLDRRAVLARANALRFLGPRKAFGARELALA